MRVKTIARSTSGLPRILISVLRFADRSTSITCWSIFSIGRDVGATATSAGLFKKSLASFRIAGGMVADSRAVWRSRGTRAMILRIAGMKPRSSI